MELVKIIDGKSCTSSRLIAQYFNKQHKDVLRAISNLDCTEEFNRRNFSPIFFTDNYGREQSEFAISRDGFTFLVMGFTGRKAAKFKKDFIPEFNRLDAIIRNQQKLLLQIDILIHAALQIKEQKKHIGYASAICKYIKSITLEEWGILIALCGLIIPIWVEIINPIIG
jgi:Rha family phage regulatory protein